MKSVMKLVWLVLIGLWLTVPQVQAALAWVVAAVVFGAALLSPVFIWVMLRAPFWAEQARERDDDSAAP